MPGVTIAEREAAINGRTETPRVGVRYAGRRVVVCVSDEVVDGGVRVALSDVEAERLYADLGALIVGPRPARPVVTTDYWLWLLDHEDDESTRWGPVLSEAAAYGLLCGGFRPGRYQIVRRRQTDHGGGHIESEFKTLRNIALGREVPYGWDIERDGFRVGRT